LLGRPPVETSVPRRGIDRVETDRWGLTFQTQNVIVYMMAETRRQRGASESRERILDSAARVFAAYGFRHTTFEEVAAGAGVSRTLLYRHFDGKTELLRAVRERALNAWAESVAREAQPCVTARGVLEATIRETFRFAAARPDFRAFLAGDTRLALVGEDSGGGLSRQLWREETASLLARGVEAGEFPADLAITASAEVLCAMQLGVIEQMHQVNDASLALGSAHLEAAARILVGGIAAPSDVLTLSGPRS
jgi:AcrR family transcriptional regulator